MLEFGSPRDRFIVAMAVIVTVALLAFGVQLLLAVLVGAAILSTLMVGEGGDRSEPAPPRTADDQPMEVAPRADRLAVARSALEALAIPAMMIDADGAVLYQNPAARQVFGFIAEGQHVSARLRAPALLDMIRDGIASGRPGEIDHSERVPSEEVYRVRIEKAPVVEGVDTFYVLSFRDISEARRIERMRSDFVANASHELRTPLASLRGFIETMQGPAKNDPAARETFLAIMLEQVTRMSRLVDDLLSLSRLELKAKIAPDKDVELGSVLKSVVASLAPLAQDVGVTLALSLPDAPATVTGDRDELTEVFENLIENACKYGQSGERVDIVMTAAEGQPVEVSVTDYGPGISDEHVPRLTERFYRVNVENSRHKKGTGLGLAIVKHILTRHRAQLSIRSELGKGSVFTVRF